MAFFGHFMTSALTLKKFCHRNTVDEVNSTSHPSKEEGTDSSAKRRIKPVETESDTQRVPKKSSRLLLIHLLKDVTKF